jgi:hypothetical protein
MYEACTVHVRNKEIGLYKIIIRNLRKEETNWKTYT